MKIIITISFLLAASFCAAQKQEEQEWAPPPPSAVKGSLVLAANQEKAKPNFNLSGYLNSNLKYPAAAQQAGIEGRVVIEFVVEKDGSISGVRAVRGKELGNGLTEEAMRVVKNMPPWKPATQNGQLVRSYMTLPVDFRLEDKSRLNSKYQFPVDKGVTLIQGALPTFDYTAYRQKQLVYPEKALAKGIQGLIVVKFIVETDAKISNVVIVEGQQLGYGLPEEAMRLIAKMPAWKPALDLNKKPVRSYVIVPVIFELKDK